MIKQVAKRNNINQLSRYRELKLYVKVSDNFEVEGMEVIL